MEILNVIEVIQKYIPSQYLWLSNGIAITMPIIIFLCELITIFFGYRFHKFWARLTMTFVSFLLVALTSVFFPNVNIKIFIVLAFLVAGLIAYFSKYLYKIQIFIINFFTVYIFLPNILGKIMPVIYSLLVSVILAIVIGILAIKYKYIITIITTSITGSMLLINQIFYKLGINKNNYIIIFYLMIGILACLGGVFQFKFSGHNETKCVRS